MDHQMDLNQEFLELLAKHKKLEDEMKQLAWQITPDDIRYLLCGERGLLENNAKQALEWLITPKWQLDEKSPTEAIIAGKAEKIKRLLHVLIHGVYF